MLSLSIIWCNSLHPHAKLKPPHSWVNTWWYAAAISPRSRNIHPRLCLSRLGNLLIDDAHSTDDIATRGIRIASGLISFQFEGHALNVYWWWVGVEVGGMRDIERESARERERTGSSSLEPIGVVVIFVVEFYSISRYQTQTFDDWGINN